MNSLLCGGAGYIRSHACKRPAREGHVPITFDNLSTRNESAVKWGPLARADLLDPVALAITFAKHRIDAVMHFAARSLVGESMQDPRPYLRSNVTGMLNLLDVMRAAGAENSCSHRRRCAYGNPEYSSIDEAHPTLPINSTTRSS